MSQQQIDIEESDNHNAQYQEKIQQLSDRYQDLNEAFIYSFTQNLKIERQRTSEYEQLLKQNKELKERLSKYEHQPFKIEECSRCKDQIVYLNNKISELIEAKQNLQNQYNLAIKSYAQTGCDLANKDQEIKRLTYDLNQAVSKINELDSSQKIENEHNFERRSKSEVRTKKALGTVRNNTNKQQSQITQKRIRKRKVL